MGQRLMFQRPPATDGLAWFRVHHRTTVRPERLTFAGQKRPQVQAAVTAVLTSVVLALGGRHVIVMSLVVAPTVSSDE